MGIGGSLIYFIDQYGDTNPYGDFNWLGAAKPAGVGFAYLDHLTHNVHKGNMDTWFAFYGQIFSFRQIRFFDIEGKYSGLFSRALTSPCGRIRIPINEDRGTAGQIVEYLKRYNGEGIQHIAVGATDLYAATDQIDAETPVGMDDVGASSRRCCATSARRSGDRSRRSRIRSSRSASCVASRRSSTIACR